MDVHIHVSFLYFLVAYLYTRTEENGKVCKMVTEHITEPFSKFTVLQPLLHCYQKCTGQTFTNLHSAF